MKKVEKYFLSHSTRWLLTLAFFVGFVYLVFVPPWQQNDEPTQFEYVRLVAQSEQWPGDDEFDPQLRREIAASMQEFNFYRGYNPPLITTGTLIEIGIPQLDGLPLYYLFASLPLRIFVDADVTFQLYLARFMSLLLFILIVLIIELSSKELFGDHLLTTLVPFTLIMTPSFVNKMTAVNDDVLAVLSLTFFMWMAVRLIKKGFSFWRFVGLMMSIGICLFSKRIGWISVPFGIMAVYLGLLRNHKNIAWAGLGVLVVVVGISVFSWEKSTPANYYVSTLNQYPTNQVDKRAIAGDRIMILLKNYPDIFQTIDYSDVMRVAGDRLVFGGWVWSDTPTIIKLPELYSLKTDGQIPPREMKTEQLSINNEVLSETVPVFVNYEVVIPPATESLVLKFLTTADPQYWDCVFLIKSINSDNQSTIPQPLNNQCSSLQWGTNVYENIIKNASMEKSWPIPNPKISSFIDKYFNFSTNDLWVIFDGEIGWSYMLSVGRNLFRTFWGGFSWGRVPLAGRHPSFIFFLIIVIGIVGALISLRKNLKRLDWNIVTFLFLISSAVIIVTLYRGAGNWYRYEFTPVARYIYPVIWPIFLFLSSVWYNLLRRINEKGSTLFFFATAGIAYHVWGLYSIWSYFYR